MRMNVHVHNQTTRGVSAHFFEQRLKVILEYTDNELNMSIEVILTSDDEIQKLNKQYRGKDATTDVLSFLFADEEGIFGHEAHGEIYISLDQIERQSKEHGVNFEKELSKIFVHGVLHLFGYDHQKEEDYIVMKKKEQEIEMALYEGEKKE